MVDTRVVYLEPDKITVETIPLPDLQAKRSACKNPPGLGLRLGTLFLSRYQCTSPG